MTSVVIFGLLSLGAAGCGVPSVAFPSAVFKGFDPAAAVKQLGYSVEPANGPGAVTNPKDRYGWKTWQGTFTPPAGTTGPVAAAKAAGALRAAIDRLAGGQSNDELTGKTPPGAPLAGQLTYLKDSMAGHVHVWLFPAGPDGAVRYAVLLREQWAR